MLRLRCTRVPLTTLNSPNTRKLHPLKRQHTRIVSIANLQQIILSEYLEGFC